ncbi:hypothetical protein M0804_014647 [Polistes exclamans]|nr:hypothetical protein M0804_014649 [Polistes exclamans]KAI4474837.1 hypothetical protein M0804_014647 [Polistes exclamans]
MVVGFLSPTVAIVVVAVAVAVLVLVQPFLALDTTQCAVKNVRVIAISGIKWSSVVVEHSNAGILETIQ